MGGCGSGRHNGVRKRRVESCHLALDVNELRRKWALTPAAMGTLTWEGESGAAGSVAFRMDKATLTLCYYAAGSREVEQHVELSLVPATFGGSRVYFTCPGADCGRRASILYFARDSFVAGAAIVSRTNVKWRIASAPTRRQAPRATGLGAEASACVADRGQAEGDVE
jgi:hypothetical protein